MDGLVKEATGACRSRVQGMCILQVMWTSRCLAMQTLQCKAGSVDSTACLGIAWVAS